MTAKVVNLPIKIELVCSGCGAAGQGSCHCDAPYVRPSKRAEAAIIANPMKSDRAIASAIGVGSNTVLRARQKTTAPSGAVRRTGKDGKTRKIPTREPQPIATREAQPIAADAPLETRVNTMVRDLDNAISPWVEDAEKWVASHGNELANEKNELGHTGKQCLAQALHAWADRLLRLAQAVDGR